MIWLTGDTHGHFDRVEEFCREHHTTTDDILIILGDSGFNFGGGERDLGDGVEPPATDGHASAGLFAFGAPDGVLHALDAAHGGWNFGLLRHFPRNLRRNLAGELSFRPRPHPRDERKAPWKRVRNRVASLSHFSFPETFGWTGF